MSTIKHQTVWDNRAEGKSGARRERALPPRDRRRIEPHDDGMPAMQVDEDARALYVEVSDGAVARTVGFGDELLDAVMVDLDADGRIVGVEVLY